MQLRQFPWGHGRRFNAYSNYFRNIYGERVQKVSVDAGFSCPNRDGTKEIGGCYYGNNDVFNPSDCRSDKSITQQIEEGIAFHAWRYRRATKYLAYFQAFSNTYAPLSHLQKLYGEALSHPAVVGLVISTRPDCLPEETLIYLSQLSKEYFIQVEIGIESCYDATLSRINRGHSFDDTIKALDNLSMRGIMTGAHLIFGLPGETIEMMLNEAQIVSQLPLTSIKLHQLQIIEGSVWATEYRLRSESFRLFERNEYVDFIIKFIERLRPEIVVERLSAEAPPRFVIAPDWGLERADAFQQDIREKMLSLQTYQGKLFKFNEK